MKLTILILACISASLSTAGAVTTTHRYRRAAVAPAPQVDCSTLVIGNMISCMQFLSSTGTETAPDASCCSGLKVVMKTKADCLCYALKSAPSMGLDLNMTRAAALPSACGITNAPSISNCTAATPTPAPGPGLSPANPPNLPPTAPPPAEAPPAASPGPSSTPSKPTSGAHSVSAAFSVIFTQLIYFSILVALA